MRITKQSEIQIKDRADILEVVQDFLSLKKKGQNYWACCPFHNEKSPSFSVAPAKGIYKCFGCGAAGDSVKFVMDIEGLSYPEALKYLANKYSIEIEEDTSGNTDEYKAQQTLRESVLIMMQFAQRYYHKLLTEDEDGKALGMSYFKERGFSLPTIEKFGLGFSKDDWHDLEKNAVKEGFTEEILEKAGLIIKKEENGKTNQYDRFRGRVMFPVYDLAGKVIAFGARTLKKDDKRGQAEPKYLNSPESEVYKKSEVLYGIFQAKNEIRNQDNCYLTEGYTDVISLHQAGIANVVASSGTSLTEGQIKLVKRFTDNITVLYDGDNAGIKASLRGIDLILEQGMNVRAVVFPQGEDPDSYVRKVGNFAFKEFLQESAKDFITFKAELLLGEVKTEPIRKAGAIREITNSISKVPDAIKREVYTQHCAELFNIDVHILSVEIDKILINKGLQEQKQKKEDIRREEEKSKNAPPPPFYVDDVPLPTEEYFTDKEVYYTNNEEVETPARKDIKYLQTIAVHEKECVRLLLKYGNYLVEGEVKLWEYLLAEIDELQFHTPVYLQMLTMYKEAITQGIKVDDSHMIRYGSPEIVEKVINLTTEKYQISENWGIMHEIVIPHESDSDKLPETAYKYILKHKYKFVKNLLKNIETQLEEELGEEEENLLLSEYNRLSMLKQQIASESGLVIDSD
ncbi:MAG: DNA primase [Cytophagales bacterium]|nr:MAG: DNA primase [Cytophagales bacterium]